MLPELKKGAPEWRTLLCVSLGGRLWPSKETDLEIGPGVPGTPLRTIDSKLGSESGSRRLQEKLGPEQLPPLYRHREGMRGLNAVRLTGRAGVWDERDRCDTIDPTHVKSIGLGSCGLSSLAVHLSPNQSMVPPRAVSFWVLTWTCLLCARVLKFSWLGHPYYSRVSLTLKWSVWVVKWCVK